MRIYANFNNFGSSVAWQLFEVLIQFFDAERCMILIKDGSMSNGVHLVCKIVARGGGRGIANLFFTQLCWRLTQSALLCYSDGYYL